VRLAAHSPATGGLVCLAGWLAPCTQINIIRDPRSGRNSELPSEDPTLSGHYASEMVQGMQEGEDQKYMKVHASLKHYTAYSVVRRNAYLLRVLYQKRLFDQDRLGTNVGNSQNKRRVFSQETNRDGIDETISEFDLHDTYLPQYAIAFQEGKAAGVMCSYNEVSKTKLRVSYQSV